MARFGIFYFSGTGNSLFAAHKLTDLLPDASLVPMRAPVSVPAAQKDFEAIVFVFPVHFLAIPKIIREYITAADFGGTRRFFAVAVHGGDPGNTLRQLGALLYKRGKTLEYAIDIAMGDNSVVLRTLPDELARRLGRVDQLLSSFARDILEEWARGDARGKADRFRPGSYTLGKTYELLFERYFHSRKGRADGEKCTGCGVCAKLCPVENIKLADGKAVWGKKCADCFACINRCPQNAVHLGRIHPKSPEAQYRGPGLKAERSNA